MERHEQLVQVLKELESPFVDELGGFHAAVEWQVATAEGAAIVSVQDGTTGPEGPVSIDSETHEFVRGLLSNGKDAVLAYRDRDQDAAGQQGIPDLDEDELLDAVGLVLSGCKPDVDYYKLVVAPDLSLDVLLRHDPDWPVLFSEDDEELQKRWAQDLVVAAGNTFTAWEDLDESDLEEWVERLDLDVPDADEDDEEEVDT